MKTALIVSGGEYSPVNMATISYDYCIACDSGAKYAAKLNIVPDVIIGDFDSYDGDVEKDFPGISIVRYPVMKDDTDTMLAIKMAIGKGYTHIILLCALGNRLDHLMANIESLHYIASRGGKGEIYTEDEYIATIIPSYEPTIISKRPGFSLSLFSLTDICMGLSIRGTKYTTENITLTNSFPLGHGNSITDDKASVSIESGVLLVIESRIR